MVNKRFVNWIKGKPLDFYITNTRYLNKGFEFMYYGKFIVQSCMGISIVLKLFIDPPFEVYIVVMGISSLLVLVLSWLVGRFWDYIRGWDAEIEWGNKRNPMLKRIAGEK